MVLVIYLGLRTSGRMIDVRSHTLLLTKVDADKTKDMVLYCRFTDFPIVGFLNKCFIHVSSEPLYAQICVGNYIYVQITYYTALLSNYNPDNCLCLSVLGLNLTLLFKVQTTGLRGLRNLCTGFLNVLFVLFVLCVSFVNLLKLT